MDDQGTLGAGQGWTVRGEEWVPPEVASGKLVLQQALSRTLGEGQGGEPASATWGPSPGEGSFSGHGGHHKGGGSCVGDEGRLLWSRGVVEHWPGCRKGTRAGLSSHLQLVLLLEKMVPGPVLIRLCR